MIYRKISFATRISKVLIAKLMPFGQLNRHAVMGSLLDRVMQVVDGGHNGEANDGADKTTWERFEDWNPK